MNKPLEQVSKILKKNADFLQDFYNVKKIGVFGSVLRGDYKNASDIDVLIELKKPISMFKFIELEDYLSKILKKKVDLATKAAIKPAIREEVFKDTVYV